MYFSKGSICNLIFEQSKDVIIKVETLRPARSTSNNATSFPFLSFTYATIYFLGVMPSSKTQMNALLCQLTHQHMPPHFLQNKLLITHLILLKSANSPLTYVFCNDLTSKPLNRLVPPISPLNGCY